MKKQFLLLTIAVVMLILSACAEAQPTENGQISEHEEPTAITSNEAEATDEQADENHATVVVTTEENEANKHIESSPSNAVGGLERECYLHTYPFCGGCIFDIFIIEEIVSLEDFGDWVVPLRAMRSSPYDECLINAVTLIEHFNISREVFQQVLDNLHPFAWRHMNLDVLYSGDWDLINQYYHIENEELHRQLAQERHDQYYSEQLMELQQLQQTINANVSGQYSLYFHDIWTYVNFLGSPTLGHNIIWMQELIDVGEYDRINIVELVNHFNMPVEAFERLEREYNINLFTHYNLDVIFSDDPVLIADYYSAENEAAHTAIVETAFEQFVAMHGIPDTSWMLD
jgi:hypothetical protein